MRSGKWGDAYEASRILAPDLIHRLGVPEPVALVPFRNALLVTSARNPSGLKLMLQVAQTSLENNQRWLSFEPIRLNGERWTAHDPLKGRWRAGRGPPARSGGGRRTRLRQPR